MITKNFKQLTSVLLQSGGPAAGLLPIVNINGDTRYITPSLGTSTFPYRVVGYVSFTASGAGISFGTGTTPATEDDYNLESTITQSFTNFVNAGGGMDDDGNPYLKYDIIVTNNGTESITITEIGYKQTLRGRPQRNVAEDETVYLFDRTVLSTPITIDVGEYKTIRYILKTIVS